MADYDVFNGDADGICSLLQLRLDEPRKSILVTGVKRDIKLLDQVDAQKGDRLTVLDISMEKNIGALKRNLDNGAEVFYTDHHRSGEIPVCENLEAYIDLSSDTCTALIIDEFLNGRFRSWALTAAFGDNLKKEARGLAKASGFSEDETSLMDKLGTYINYNGYGSSLDDLFYSPKELYLSLLKYFTPFDFIINEKEIFERLESGYRSDMQEALALKPELLSTQVALYILPDEKWARRVSGVYSNQLSLDNPDRAHAVLTERSSGDYLVSIRAPKNNPIGASDIASMFSTGGGRSAAAGINVLKQECVDSLFNAITEYYK
ncbi:MAG: hypothetical protein NE330_03755 [Lentisphaeraceae bacterium]|nr:hypothetical protein [Lentisphaeraceae bacterium]